jgi:CHAT domain-containing protein/tetratricopeptide (TPR) repeat protein
MRTITVIIASVIFLAAGLSTVAAQSRDEGVRIFNEAKKLQDTARSNEDLKKAVEKYEAALKIFEKVKDEKNLSAILNNLGLLFSNWGEHLKAWKCLEKSLAIARKVGDVMAEANALNNLGFVHMAWRENHKAVAYYEKSLELCRGKGHVQGEGCALMGLGEVHRAWGHYLKAVEYYEQSLELKRKTGDVQGEGQALNNLGIVHEAWGKYAKAAEYFEQSLELFRKTGDVRGEGKALNNLGIVFKDWGQHAKAAEYFEQSLELFRKTGDARGEGITLNNRGMVYQAWGEYDKALADFQQGLEICLRIGLPAEWPRSLMGHLYLDKGDFRSAESFVKETRAWALWGRLYLLKSDYGTAKNYYDILWLLGENTRNIDYLFIAYTGLGMACEGLGDNPGAADWFDRAIDSVEELRAGLREAERAEFYNVPVHGFYRTAPYEGLARVLTKINKPTAALKNSEYTKARMFAEALSRRNQGSTLDVPREILSEDSGLNEQLAALSKSLQTGYEKANKDVIAALEPQVKEAKGKLEKHVSMLRKEYPLFAATKYPQPMGLDQAALKDGEWALIYDVTDPGILVYLARGKNLVKGLFKPVPRKEIDDLVRTFRQPLEAVGEEITKEKLSAFDFASGKKLSDILLADVLSDLPNGVPVIIIPDDSLGVLPFEMLVLNDGGKVLADKKIPYVSEAEFFGDRNPISYYQSITALTLARTLGKHQKSGEKVLAMVDPIFSPDDSRLAKIEKDQRQKLLANLHKDILMSIQTQNNLTFPRLPLTGELGKSLKKADEARTDLHEGMQAKKQTLLEKDLSGYGSVVFATHGYFGRDLPGIQEPVLVLTLLDQPKDQDGFLRLSEVMGLKINADIVALTACQTGLGRHISGEGTMGMGRAFQYAGAKSVLMSLWSVSETSSVKLVESFFKHLKEGKSKLEALRLARKEIRDAGYDHPFFWAPFILVGEVR